jgi:hypothetical protein
MEVDVIDELELEATAPEKANDAASSEEESSTEIINRIMKCCFKLFKLLVQKSEQMLQIALQRTFQADSNLENKDSPSRCKLILLELRNQRQFLSVQNNLSKPSSLTPRSVMNQCAYSVI